VSRTRKFRITINGRSYEVEVVELTESREQQPKTSPTPTITKPTPTVKKPSPTGGTVTSPIPGKIVSVKVKVGDKVKRGECLVVIDSMKMENEIVAPRDGTVKDILVFKGMGVNTGDPLVVIE